MPAPTPPLVLQPSLSGGGGASTPVTAYFEGLGGKLPPSGSEPVYSPEKWGTSPAIRGSNCYDYSFDDFRESRPVKTVPGDKAGVHPPDSARYDQCPDVAPYLLIDNPDDVYYEGELNPCKQGFYKVQMFVGGPRKAGGSYGDFHFYRQDGDVQYTVEPGDTIESVAAAFGVARSVVLDAAGGRTQLQPGTTLAIRGAATFSHKAGWATGALLKDSCGNIIHNPRDACRDGAVPYKTYCGSFCVKKGTTTSGVPARSTPDYFPPRPSV